MLCKFCGSEMWFLVEHEDMSGHETTAEWCKNCGAAVVYYNGDEDDAFWYEFGKGK